MENKITIREAVTDSDAALFWEQLRIYQKRDLFPDPADEDREYFLSDTEYRAHIQKIHDRPQDRCYYLFFRRNGQDIGFALPVIYNTEDGKCFLMEFCVYPEFRGSGTGKQCAGVFLKWAKENGAAYTELNYGSDERRLRFWESAGFVKNGADEWGEPLMLLPPGESVPVTIELLADPEDWQLLKLENGFRMETGGEALTEEEQERLRLNIRAGRIIFFLAKRGCRAVGMCSVSADGGEWSLPGALYVEPAFRRQGIAGRLAKAARHWRVGRRVPLKAPDPEL